jgi:hypothetical protein
VLLAVKDQAISVYASLMLFAKKDGLGTICVRLVLVVLTVERVAIARVVL